MTKGSRKYAIASRMTWMTFVVIGGMLVVAWATNDQQGETVRTAITSVADLWWKALGAVGLWFGGANVGEHFAAAKNGNGEA